MRTTSFISGDWNAICDVCGFKFKASQLRERWDGLMVCEKDWETRHPQDLIRPLPDEQKLPWTRPEPADTYISVTYNSLVDSCTLEQMNGGVDYYATDCARIPPDPL